MIRSLPLAAIASLLLGSVAWSAPLPNTAVTTQQATSSQVEQVARRSHRNYRHHRHYRRGFRGHRHYRRAPRGWHRYSHRPHRWRERGCIIIGPVWFCP